MNDAQRFEQLKNWSAKQKHYQENPELNVIDVTPQPMRFRYKMSWLRRVDILLASLFLLVVGTGLLAAGLFVIYILFVK